MAFRATIHRARHDVAGVQSALASVQTGLDVVESAAEAVDGVRRTARFRLIIIVAIGVVMVVAMVKSRRSDTATDET
jgi:hypothetical protein